jgi:hypothetical protein
MGIHSRVGGGNGVEPLLAFAISIAREQVTMAGRVLRSAVRRGNFEQSIVDRQ